MFILNSSKPSARSQPAEWLPSDADKSVLRETRDQTDPPPDCARRARLQSPSVCKMAHKLYCIPLHVRRLTGHRSAFRQVFYSACPSENSRPLLPAFCLSDQSGLHPDRQKQISTPGHTAQQSAQLSDQKRKDNPHYRFLPAIQC